MRISSITTGSLGRPVGVRPRAAFDKEDRRLLLLVSAVVFVDTLFFAAITPLLPHYVSLLRLSKSEAGLLVAAYPAGTLVGSIPGGMLASRLGVRQALVIGLGLMSGATLAFGFGHSAVLLDAARFAQGLGGACTWAGALAWLVAAVPPHRRAAALGIAFSGAIGGALFGPALGALATRIGTAPCFAAASVAGVALAVDSLRVHAPTGEESPSLRGAIQALRDRQLTGGLGLTLLAGLSFGVVDVLTPLRLHALGAGGVLVGGAFLGAAAIEAAVAPIVGRLADRRGRVLPVRASLAVSVLVALILPLASPAPVLVVAVVAGLPAFAALYVPAAALVSDGSKRQGIHQGLGFGLLNLAWAAGQALAAAGSGALAQATSDLVPYVLLAVAFVLVLVVLLMGPLREKDRAVVFGSSSVD